MAARNRRVVVIVALAALIAAAAVVGATVFQTRGEHTTVSGAVVKPRAGQPPLALNFGVETSAEARALTRAQALYNGGHVAQAAAIFARYHSLESQIGSAFAAWNKNGLATVQSLAGAHPASSVALLHLGIADYWAGQNADAVAEWEQAARVGADSPFGVKAEDLLHPTLKIPGLPYLVLDFHPPRAIGKLPLAEQLAALARAAAKPDARAQLQDDMAVGGDQAFVEQDDVALRELCDRLVREVHPAHQEAGPHGKALPREWVGLEGLLPERPRQVAHG